MTRFHNQLGYPFQTLSIVLIESTNGKTIQIQNPKYHDFSVSTIRFQNKGTNDLTLCISVTCDMSGI
jgi:hypothetical protein